MFSSNLLQQQQQQQQLTSTWGTSDGADFGGRLQSLVDSFESRVHLLAVYAYDVVCAASPLPFGVTVALVVFTCIAVQQLVLWYRFDLQLDTKGYVYWCMTDLIDTEYRDSYKRSNHLCTAMLVYITQKLWRDRPLTAEEAKNKVFTVHLLSLYAQSVTDAMEECYSDDDFRFREKEETMIPVKVPVFPGWTPTHSSGVEVCTWISTTRIKNCYAEAHRYIYLRVKKANTAEGGAEADAVLRRFVDDAMAFYFANGYADRDDHSLLTFHVAPTAHNSIQVTTGPLHLVPTLDTLFFPQRAAVQQQLRRFSEMKGRYAIQGFPRKLGFLLHGPRGTGKRSFVRALAYHTQRNIVRIPLSRLRKNEQLFSIFYFEKVALGSTEKWAALKSNRVIFLLEDVDCESELVRARDAAHTAWVRRSRGLTTRDRPAEAKQLSAAGSGDVDTAAAAAAAGAPNIATAGEDEDGALTSSSSVSSSGSPVPPSTRRVAAPRETAVVKKPLPVPPVTLGWGTLFAQEDEKLDRINLSTLLNVLDGAIEDPERIVVMIADRPEILDPALLRPGRLATHLRFDYLELPDLIGMCGLFFGTECAGPTGTLLSNGASTKRSTDTDHGIQQLIAKDALLPRFPHETADPADKLGRSSASSSDTDAGEDGKSTSWQRQDSPMSSQQDKLDAQVIRQLSPVQAAQVRACVAALELEEEMAAKSNTDHNSSRGVFNFLITPAHAHHLCMHAKTLEQFLESLTLYIRQGDVVKK